MVDVPAAFRRAVNRLALTIAFTLPLFASNNTVLAGKPDSPARGIETILRPCPAEGAWEGMNREVA